MHRKYAQCCLAHTQTHIYMRTQEAKGILLPKIRKNTSGRLEILQTLFCFLIARSVLGNQNILPFTADFALEIVLVTQRFEGVAAQTVSLLNGERWWRFVVGSCEVLCVDQICAGV